MCVNERETLTVKYYERERDTLKDSGRVREDREKERERERENE